METADLDGMKPKVIKQRVNKSLWWSLGLIVLAIIVPILSATGLMMPSSEKLPIWFQRSGAITTVFSLMAGPGTASVLDRLIPRGPRTLEIRYSKLMFEIPFEGMEWVAFFTTIGGTIIWGYGDLLILFF